MRTLTLADLDKPAKSLCYCTHGKNDHDENGVCWGAPDGMEEGECPCMAFKLEPVTFSPSFK